MLKKIYRFYPAGEGEEIVFGSARPGAGLFPAGYEEVKRWLEFVKGNGIQRVCVLLTEGELMRYYNFDLLDIYLKAFGAGRVCYAPVEDFSVVPPELMKYKIIPFLRKSDITGERVVVHCANGLGRTGQVMAAWLVQGRGWEPEDALEEVKRLRRPLEPVVMGGARMEDLMRSIKGV